MPLIFLIIFLFIFHIYSMLTFSWLNNSDQPIDQLVTRFKAQIQA